MGFKPRIKALPQISEKIEQTGMIFKFPLYH